MSFLKHVGKASSKFQYEILVHGVDGLPIHTSEAVYVELSRGSKAFVTRVVLSEEDVALIRRLQKHRFIDANMNPYPDAVHYEYADKLHPLSSATPAKKSFVPSRWEAKKVMKLVMAMRSLAQQRAAPFASHDALMVLILVHPSKAPKSGVHDVDDLLKNAAR